MYKLLLFLSVHFTNIELVIFSKVFGFIETKNSADGI